MANKDFNIWLSQFRETIADYKYYVDFNTVFNNASKFKVELNILNSLIGSQDIENEFLDLVSRYPEVIKCIPILLAKRENEIYCVDSNGEFTYSFANMNYTKEQYAYFMKETGLFDLISKHIINNLFDYVTGVEAGLSSNGRKNRGGHLMENLVESFIKKAGFVKEKTYFKEMYLSDLEKKTGLDLSKLSNSGSTEKRFDYVIISNKCVYACECNFYSSGGSKLNETARSYKTLALEAKDINGFKFVWFTDGQGWTSAKNNLKETFDVLDDIYNIKELENDILTKF
ncbi:MAG: type II restriction endonuclease [Acholeplasmatales bacterium]|nr:type II restriction endonuclease [Acholeplasmatales bacterium]